MYRFFNTKLRTGAGSAASRAGRLGGDAATGVVPKRAVPFLKVKEAVTSLGQGYQRVAQNPKGGVETEN
jgi:hypothetical protein